MKVNQKIKLKRNLWAAMGGGIAIFPNSNSHSEIKLHPTQNSGAVQFPIAAGSFGDIVGEDNKVFNIRLTSNDKSNGMYSYQQVNLIINKSAFVGFFENMG